MSCAGVRYTVKDGIVYDSRRLLDDVALMVPDAKVKAGLAPDAPLTLATELPGR